MTHIGGVRSVFLAVTVHLILGEYDSEINLEGHEDN